MSLRTWDRGTQAIGAALTFAVAAALFAWGGHWLDGRFRTSPLFLILGAVIGLLGGFIHLVNALAPELLPFGRKKRGATDHDGDDAPGSAS